MGRGRILKEGLQLIKAIRDGPVTYEDLIQQFKLSKRTIQRNIDILEEVGIPIIRDYESGMFDRNSITVLFTIDRRWKL